MSKLIYTSNFARLKQLRAAGLHTVAISCGIPGWYKGDRDMRLAPTREMLSMSMQDYDIHFRRLLEQLDPREVYASLPENAVMLCWESHNVKCHRRWVAEWLESTLGIIVPEYGFDRNLTKSYSQSPLKAAAKKAATHSPSSPSDSPASGGSIPGGVILKKRDDSGDKGSGSAQRFLF